MYIPEGPENTSHHITLTQSILRYLEMKALKNGGGKKPITTSSHEKKSRVTIISKILVESNTYSFLPRYYIAKPHLHLSSTHLT